MMTNERSAKLTRVVRGIGLWLLVWTLLDPHPALGAGTWVPLIGQPANGVGLMLLLSDGTVLAASRIPALPSSFPPSGPSKGWSRLHPNLSGHYVTGLWTPAADMHDTRLYFSSAVLQDGRVLVAGGEYGSGSSTSEIYDPVADVWTQVPVPPSFLEPNNNPPPGTNNSYGFSDSGCKILANGNVMVAPVYPTAANGTLIFNPSTSTWSRGPASIGSRYSQNEASWVKLPDDSILTADAAAGGTNSERYIPSLTQWIPDKGLPVSLYDSNTEMGAALLLPNGKALFLGSTSKTALYTPSGGTNLGSWVAGPDIPNNLVAADAPAAMMVNGKVLCAFSAGYKQGPTSFYEYDYSSGPVGSFTAVSSPPLFISTTDDPAFGDTMLALPDGTVLFSHNFGGGLGNGLFIYQPDGAPLPSGKPTIAGITPNPDGSYHLTGTLFNGISEGAAYGDDAQMDSNYPLVRLTDFFGNVFYARTYNWSSTSVMTGNQPVTTEFNLPSLLPPGIYNVAVVANGIASDTIALPHIVYVDRANPCLRPEDLAYPFNVLAGYVPGWSWGSPAGLGVTLSPTDPPPGAPVLPCPPPPLPCSISVCLGGPFKKVTDAVNNASSNDGLYIAAGNYNEQFSGANQITKRLTLTAHGGTVIIGQP